MRSAGHCPLGQCLPSPGFSLEMTERPLTPVLVGPTGVGKTAVAVALASLTPITVISADARQVYRDLDIGTAKPDRATLGRVPHRGLDLIHPGERYSAGDRKSTRLNS